MGNILRMRKLFSARHAEIIGDILLISPNTGYRARAAAFTDGARDPALSETIN